MKPIIVDMREMSDSTEIYESKPSPMLSGFIYLVLGMVAAACVWMYFCKIDIVVKGVGTVAAAEEVATVTNQVAGVVASRNIEDGQVVKKGDVLYIVSHEEQEMQLASLEQQLDSLVEKEEMLKAYEMWLENGEEFSDELTKNLYYSEVSSRKRLVELGQESALQSYAGELAAYDVKLNTNSEMISYYGESVEKAEKLIEAIKTRTNSFAKEETYYWNAVENYLVQYQSIINQYDEKINELEQQKRLVVKDMEALEGQKLVLQEQLSVKAVASVSAGDVSQGSTLQAELQELELKLLAQTEAKAAVESSIYQYQISKNSALSVCEKENIAAIETNILTYKQNMTAYEGTQKEYVNGKNTLKEQGTAVTLGNLVTQEKYSVAEELESCRSSKLGLQSRLESLEKGIEAATVKATMDGKINLTADLVEGDYISAGVQVLTIIPDTEAGAFVVESYVENNDIAKIRDGMEVVYEVGAYPSREYGKMMGEVTFVSADLKVNNSGSAYYMVETSVDTQTLHNKAGEEAALKVGMLCETKIVIEQRRVLEVLAEKLFHMGES